MPLRDNQPLSPTGRALMALAAVAAGVLPILAALDLGPLHHEDIHGPPWIAGAAGGAFVMAGVAVAAGQSAQMRWIANIAGALAAVALAAIGNWIALGVGERECTSSISGFFFSSSRLANNIECRAVFGLGAAMLDGVLIYGLGVALRKRLGQGRVQGAVEKLGLAILLIAISPLLLILVVMGLGKGMATGLREYWSTGRWPRNESFIARMKARRDASR